LFDSYDLIPQRNVLETRDLRYFTTVAELEHLGRAAEALEMTQPALSKCIDRLERDCRGQLLERVGRGVKLTEAGRLLYERARLMKQMLDTTCQDIESLASGSAGHIRIGAAATVAEFLLPGICRMLLTESPKVSVDIHIGMNDVMRTMLRDDQLDVVIGPLLDDEREFICRPIARDQVVVAASHAHPMAGRDVDLSALGAWNWVLPAKTVATRQWLEAVFARHGLKAPTVQIEASSIAALPRLIGETHLLSFLSRRNLGDGRPGALVEIPHPATTMDRYFGVVCRSKTYLTPATRRLIAIAEKHGTAFMGEVL
jgi:DNA-binding transcriptional LysR family regulator